MIAQAFLMAFLKQKLGCLLLTILSLTSSANAVSVNARTTSSISPTPSSTYPPTSTIIGVPDLPCQGECEVRNEHGNCVLDYSCLLTTSAVYPERSQTTSNQQTTAYFEEPRTTNDEKFATESSTIRTPTVTAVSVGSHLHPVVKLIVLGSFLYTVLT